MTRTVAQRVAADLAREPRRHDWTPAAGGGQCCDREGCAFVWLESMREPTGCRGANAS